MAPATPSIQAATRAYEHWLGGQLTLNAADLRLKHERMAERPFDFMRATFSRFAQRWPGLAGEAKAPQVDSVGGLHVENFGTWRDAEGRLAWGVNDFDEAARLPYTLPPGPGPAGPECPAGQRRRPARAGRSSASGAILAGYRAGPEAGGRPFILEEQHLWLRDLVRPNPVRFWKKLRAWPGSAPRPPCS